MDDKKGDEGGVTQVIQSGVLKRNGLTLDPTETGRAGGGGKILVYMSGDGPPAIRRMWVPKKNAKKAGRKIGPGHRWGKILEC